MPRGVGTCDVADPNLCSQGVPMGRIWCCGGLGLGLCMYEEVRPPHHSTHEWIHP